MGTKSEKYEDVEAILLMLSEYRSKIQSQVNLLLNLRLKTSLTEYMIN